MKKYTPGPWKYELSDGKFGDQQIIAPPIDVCIKTKEIIMCNEEYYPTCPINEADWHLISAAPELLEACKAFVAYDDGEKEDDFITMMFAYSYAVEKARAAIAKAEGKA
jgi:hypothetical protein